MTELCANIKLNSIKVFACPEISLIMLFHNNLVVIFDRTDTSLLVILTMYIFLFILHKQGC